MTEHATLGGGCFWCLEAVFDRLRGVESVVSGYAGGHAEDPTYRQVCAGGTGHAEVVRVAYDPDVVTYGELLEVFFATHDPTTPDRQGNDVGPQYRSIILYHDEGQRETATSVIEMLESEDVFDDQPVDGHPGQLEFRTRPLRRLRARRGGGGAAHGRAQRRRLRAEPGSARAGP